MTSLVPVKIVVACVLVDRDDRILLAQRPANKDMGGLWEFPGGKVGKDELPEQALVRELKEELDVNTQASCLAPLTFASHSYDDFHLLMPLYICRRWQGFAKGLEGQNLKWVKKHDLRRYPMPPADLPLIPHIMQYL